MEWTTSEIILLPILTLITIVTILANSFVLFLFIKGKETLRTPSHFLLANLALADLGVGFLVMPMLTSITISTGYQWQFGIFLCSKSDYVHFVFCAFSMLSTIAIGVERLIGVTWPLKHKIIVTRRRVRLAIALVWTMATLLAWIPLSIWPKDLTGIKDSGERFVCPRNTRRKLFMFMGYVVHLLPLVIVVGLYAAIAIIARRKIEVDQLTESGTARAIRAKAQEVKLAKRVALLTTTIFFMFGPLCMFFILNGVGPCVLVNSTMHTVLQWIRFCNSMVNPFIYALSVPGYKAEFNRVFRPTRMAGSSRIRMISSSKDSAEVSV